MNRSSNSRVWNWARTRMAESLSEVPRALQALDLLADAARFLRPVPDADDAHLVALDCSVHNVLPSRPALWAMRPVAAARMCGVER